MPFLNLDDNFADHPKVDGLSDGAFRQVVRDACEWAKTGRVSSRVAPFVRDGLMTALCRRPKIPSALRLAVYERDGFACLHCGASEGLSLDHIHPWSLGGPDTLENLQTLCRSCNSKKGARV